MKQINHFCDYRNKFSINLYLCRESDISSLFYVKSYDDFGLCLMRLGPGQEARAFL